MTWHSTKYHFYPNTRIPLCKCPLACIQVEVKASYYRVYSEGGNVCLMNIDEMWFNMLGAYIRHCLDFRINSLEVYL